MSELFHVRPDVSFKRITVKDVKPLNDYFRYANVFEVPSDNYPIGGLTYLESAYAVIDGFIFIVDGNKELMGIPLDKSGLMIDAEHLHDVMLTYKIKSVKLVPEGCAYLERYSDVVASLFMTSRMDGFGQEYIFDNYILRDLAGGQYRNMRRNIKAFERQYGDAIEVIPYDASMYKDAMESNEAWKQLNGRKLEANGHEIWDEEFFQICMKHNADIDLDVFLIRDIKAGHFVGCFAHEIIADDYAYGVFRKVRSDYEHMSQFVLWTQAKMLAGYGIQYFNDAYDADNAGLREFKTGFKPVRINKFIKLRPRKNRK